MIGKRGKNYLKKFVIVETKAEFDKIGYAQEEPRFYEKNDKCEQNIIVPKYQTISCPPPPKSMAKIPTAYIKTIGIRNWMSKQKYQLDSTDLCFLENKYPKLGQKVFIQILVALEKAASRWGTELDYRRLMRKILNYNNFVNDQQMMKAIFIYWRNKRKNFRSPILRLFWTKTQIGPFKQREEDNSSLCLRNRTLRVEEDQIKIYIRNDLLKLKQIILTMRTRQKQQQTLINLQAGSFEKACKKVLKKVEANLKKETLEIQNEQDEQAYTRTKPKKAHKKYVSKKNEKAHFRHVRTRNSAKKGKVQIFEQSLD